MNFATGSDTLYPVCQFRVCLSARKNRSVKATMSISSVVLLVTISFSIFSCTALGAAVNNGQRRSTAFAPSGYVANNNTAFDEKPIVCLTPGCVLLAAQLLNSIDLTVDPCDDFFQYTCGKYIATHAIPDDRAEIGVYQDLEEQMDIKLKSELESTLIDEHQSVTVQKARSVYEACMNTTEITQRGVQPALDFLRATNPWPVVDDDDVADDSSFDVEQSIANIARLGKSALISVKVAVDSNNASKYVLYVDQPSLGMPSRDYLLRNGTSDASVHAYYHYMTSVASILKQQLNDLNKNATSELDFPQQIVQLLSSTEKDRHDSELLDVVEFEIKLANITTAKEARRDPGRLYNPMTVRQLSQIAPEFEWKRFFNAYLNGSGNTVDEQNEIVVVAEPDYLTKLMQLLKQTPATVVANYLGWRTLETFIVHLDGAASALQAARLRYAKAISGQTTDPSRWKLCLALTKSNVVMGTGRLYVEKFFNPAEKTLADDIIRSIQEAFEQQLPKLKWLGERERKLSLDKMRSMLRLIAYDDRLLNSTWLDDEYSLYVGNNKTHFENMVGNAHASDAMMQRRLQKPADRRQWDDNPIDVNANYIANSNSIMFLAGFLQPPFFSADQPMSTNFGGIGTVMGHEITHGFDDEGRHFDKDGAISDWWEQETIDNFKRETQCVVDFYSNYSLPEVGLNVNGNFTLGENLADLGGVRLSYRAYTNWNANNKQQADVRLPGLLNFSSDQLFFLSGGLMWCNYVRPESRRQRILTDEHSPQNFRVLGQFSNFPEFSQAFKCPLGSNMNPTNMCRVW